MKKRSIHVLLNYFIGIVWLINGFFCKVLDLVPRHQEIVARILNVDQPRFLTLLIGLAEMSMAIWVLSNRWSRFNAIAQIIIIAIMNILEFFLAPDLLLWGKANAIFAFIFILLIYYKEFYLNNKITQKAACYPS
jgi:hypothetical protein